MNFKGLLSALLAVVAMGAGQPTLAQDSAKMPELIKMVVGYSPGGATDTLSRILAAELQGELKTMVIVENKPGAGGRLSLSALRNGPQDGSVVILAPNALTVLQSIVYDGKIDYDVGKNYVNIARLATFPFGLAVPVNEPIHSSKDLIAYLRANPGKAAYGTSAAGGHAHFAGLMYAKAAGIDWTLIPYKGGAPLITDLAGGHLIAGIDTIVDQIQHHRGNKVRIIDIFSPERYTLAPEIPTMVEQGINTPAIEGWYAAYVPAGTPTAVSDRISKALEVVLAKPQVKAKLKDMLLESAYLSPTASKRLQDAEFVQWRPVVKASGFKPE